MEILEKNPLEIKSDLHKFINNSNDYDLLKSIYLLFTKNNSVKENEDFWFNLPKQLKNEIDKAIAEADSGELISHNKAMELIHEKIQNL